MNAEDCATHRELIDAPGPGGIYYPWTCECEGPDKVAWDAGEPNMAQCTGCEYVYPLMGDLSNPADEGWCPICDEPVERL